MKRTIKAYKYLKENTNWRNHHDAMDSLYEMGEISAKMENAAINYKKLYEMAKEELKKFIPIIVCLFLVSCTSNPPIKNPPWIGTMKNACLPEAITMTQGLKNAGIQAKVLSIYTKDWGHATCVYMYSAGQNKLWVWDSYWQSVNLRAWWNDPMDIAKAWMAWRYDTTPIKNAVFQE